MLNLHTLNAQDLAALSPQLRSTVSAQLLALLTQQREQIEQRNQQIAQRDKQIASQAQAIKFRDVQIERITFELARLKAWKFAAKTERMSAEQRQLFEATCA